MKLTRQTLWTGATPAYVGATLLAALAALRLAATATTARVFVAGRELAWGCLFQRAFGIPCPVCGMTRGVLLMLHGRLTDALSTNPAAPLLVAGVALFASAMIFVAAYQRAHTPRETGRLHARVRLALRAYAGLLFAVLFAHWVAEIFAR
ncbi:MAG: DUF2752 domain-containing protein [Acidobacteria bacterium]|nr:DUF2752 domain-containing protein [Acidobacteriota bacterium]